MGRPPFFSLHDRPAGMMKGLVPTPVFMFKFHSWPREQPPAGYPSGQERLILMVRSTPQEDGCKKEACRPWECGFGVREFGVLGTGSLVRNGGGALGVHESLTVQMAYPMERSGEGGGPELTFGNRDSPSLSECRLRPGVLSPSAVPMRYPVPMRRLIGRYEIYASVGNWPSFPGGANGKEPACQCRRHKRLEFDPWVWKIPRKRAQQPTRVFLPGDSHGQRSLVGCSPWGPKELDTAEAT